MATLYTPESPDNKSIRELRDELRDLNKTFKKAIRSNERVSLAIIAFAVVQVVIMLLQFFADLKEKEGTLVGLLVLFLLVIFVVLILIFFIREDRK